MPKSDTMQKSASIAASGESPGLVMDDDGISRADLEKIILQVLNRQNKPVSTGYLNHCVDLILMTPFAKGESEPGALPQYFGFLEDKINLSRDFLMAEDKILEEMQGGE